jgi:ABC-type antimicrobial peptide transport system permease subunit
MNINQSLRIIFRNKTYSILNIAGLAIGIAAAALILLWVEYQFNYNRDIPKHAYIYKVGQVQRYGDVTHTFFVSPSPLFEALNSDFPDVRCNTRYSDNKKSFTKSDDDHTPLSMDGAYADSCLFGMLDMVFVEGTAHKVFESEHAIVISEKMAEALFGARSPVGETLKDEEGVTYAVTGVFKNFRRNNTFQNDWIIPFQLLENTTAERGYVNVKHWGSNWHSTFVELHPGVDVARLNEKLSGLAAAKTDGRVEAKFFVYPLDKLRLYGEFKDGLPTGGGYIRTVRLFFWIGCIILLIACINFMNLSTARSEKRALEVGVRKTFGSRRSRLVRQFIGEAGLITFIALLVAVALIYFCLPWFNTLFSYKLTFDFTNPYHCVGLLAIGALCTLLAGSYPAFYLSSFAPLDVLKKLRKPGGSAAFIRKALVVLQFSVSFVLICATLVVFLQIRHAQRRPLGFVKENVMLFPVNTDIKQRTEAVRHELLQTGLIDNAGFSSHNVMQIWSNGGDYNWPGKAPDLNPLISIMFVTPGLLETVDIHVTEGETFTKTIEEWHDGMRMKVVINRTLANLMGEAGHVGTPIGQGSGDNYHLEVAGIVEDFVYNDIYAEKVRPLIMWNYDGYINYLLVKLREGANATEAQMKIKNILQTFSPNTSFDPLFMDDTFNRMFESERLVGRLAGLFSALAILISCLGLFGLSAFAAEQRTKEIGIRKVMGASIADILVLLGRNFMLLILIAVGIGLPVAWYVSATWLHDYEYKIMLGWGVFAATVLLISLIALLTVSAQSLRAATANPIKAIKTE